MHPESLTTSEGWRGKKVTYHESAVLYGMRSLCSLMYLSMRNCTCQERYVNNTVTLHCKWDPVRTLEP